jgi:glycosyltransferase involved in cell wall biosynthesis
VKVLVVHNRYREAGGEDAVVEAEVGLLRGAGYEVVEHVVQNPESDPRAAGAVGISVWNPLAARSVRALVEEVRPDVAHVHNTWYSLSPAVVRALRQAGVPVVMTLHNYRLMCVNAQLFRDGRPCELCVGTHPWRGVGLRCYRESAVESAAVAATISLHRLLGTWERDVDVFVALTEFARERFAAAGIPDRKLVVKPHFVTDPGERSIAPSQSNRVLFVGRLSREKGVEVLLEAWKSAPASLELLVVGEGPLRAELEHLAPPGVQFAGRLGSGEVRDLMLTSRALVFPSLQYETFGLVMVEAMAAGLPVLASRLGGTETILNPEHPEQLVESGNPSAWARALRQLTDDGLVDVSGASARDRFSSAYSQETALDNLLNTYHQAMATSVATHQPSPSG